MELFTEPTFWIGLATGACAMAILLIGFVVALGFADEADERARKAPLPSPAAAAIAAIEPSPATVARRELAGARRWPRDDVDGFAQGRPS